MNAKIRYIYPSFVIFYMNWIKKLVIIKFRIRYCKLSLQYLSEQLGRLGTQWISIFILVSKLKISNQGNKLKLYTEIIKLLNYLLMTSFTCDFYFLWAFVPLCFGYKNILKLTKPSMSWQKRLFGKTLQLIVVR